MLRVQTELKESTGKGLGIFAKGFIPKGTLIWTRSYFDQAYKEAEIPWLSQREKMYLYKYGYQEEGEWILCCDESKYMNHSSTPNTLDNEKGTFARRDIQAGEEITCNYFEICEWTKENGLGFEEK